MVDPSELSTYEALTDPIWQGRILVRTSTNLYNQSLVGSLIAAHGVEETEDWVKGFVANFAREPEGNDTAQIQAAAAGLGNSAIANTYYLVRQAKSDDPAEQEVTDNMRVFYPNQDDRGSHVNISGAGLLKNAPHPEAVAQ